MGRPYIRLDLDIVKMEMKNEKIEASFGRYIAYKENLQRINKVSPLPRGQFYITARNICKDLGLSSTREANRLIKLYESYGIIRPIFKSKSRKEPSVYFYVVVETVNKMDNETNSETNEADKNENLDKKIETINETDNETNLETSKKEILKGNIKNNRYQTLAKDDETKIINKLSEKYPRWLITEKIKEIEKLNLTQIESFKKLEHDLQTIMQQINEIWDLYPNKKGKAIVIERLPKLFSLYGYIQIRRTVERYNAEVQGRKKIYIKQADNFFNGTFIDFLDENYKENEEHNVETQQNKKPNKLLGWN